MCVLQVLEAEKTVSKEHEERRDVAKRGEGVTMSEWEECHMHMSGGGRQQFGAGGHGNTARSWC